MFDFCSFKSAHPLEEVHRREAGGWEAESFVEAEGGVGEYLTHPKQFLCLEPKPLTFTYLRSKSVPL